MNLIDLTHTIENNMPVYPGDKNVILYEDKNYDKDFYTSYILKSGMHSGTHIDAPMHITKDKRFINEFSLNNFYGKGVFIDARGKDIIDVNEDFKKSLQGKEIVIIYTGFEEKYGCDEYYNNHPVFSKELVEVFKLNNIKMVGFDMPSPDKEPYEIHKMLLNNNIFILENLCNLDKLLNIEDFTIMCFPLKIKAEGSLVRAVAMY